MLMNCYLVSRDLMFSSQVGGAAAQAGLELQTVNGIEQISCAEKCIVLIDLSLQDLDLERSLRDNQELDACFVAIGPHVHTEKLEAARRAGAQHVLSKGQAQRELGALLRTIVSA